MIILKRDEDHFASLKNRNLLHIGALDRKYYVTHCGMGGGVIRFNLISARKIDNSDPDTFVCKRCIKSAAKRGRINVDHNL